MINRRPFIALFAILLVVWVVYNSEHATTSRDYLEEVVHNSPLNAWSVSEAADGTEFADSENANLKELFENLDGSVTNEEEEVGSPTHTPILETSVPDQVELSGEPTPFSGKTENGIGADRDAESTESDLEQTDGDNFEDLDLKDLCEQTKWQLGLWLQCYSGDNGGGSTAGGSLNEVRNRIQTCIRFAIDAGSGLIFTPIDTLKDSAIKSAANETSTPFSNSSGSDPIEARSEGAQCPETLFDIPSLATELGLQCPHLQLRMCGEEAIDSNTIALPTRNTSGASYHRGSFGEMVSRAISDSKVRKVTKHEPATLTFSDPFLAWNYTLSHEHKVRKSLFKVLSFNPELLAFGDETLTALGPREPFIAVHLRGTTDWPSEFGSVDLQMKLYMEEFKEVQKSRPEKEISTIFVSSRFKETVAVFREKLAPLNYTVHDKWFLLESSPEMAERMNSLDFAQRAVVDYQVLAKADYFFGMLLSTMSALVAYARMADGPEDLLSVLTEQGATSSAGSREWPQLPVMKGNERTKVLVVDAESEGLDMDHILDNFP